MGKNSYGKFGAIRMINHLLNIVLEVVGIVGGTVQMVNMNHIKELVKFLQFVNLDVQTVLNKGKSL